MKKYTFLIVAAALVLSAVEYNNIELSKNIPDKAVETNYVKKINKNETSPVEVNKKVEDKSNKYIDSRLIIPEIKSNDKRIQDSINNKISGDINSFYNKNYGQAKSDFDINEKTQIKYVANTDYLIKKNTKNILSLVIRYYTYNGGVHGYYEDVPYNYDLNSKKFISLSDLFKQNSNYVNLINAKIKKQISDLEKKNKDNKDEYQFKSIKENQKFYISDNNLIIYFDLYDISPYVAGIPEFKINESQLEKVMDDKYKNDFL